MFRLNLYFPLILSVLLMSLFTVLTLIYIQEDSIHKSKEGISKQFSKNLKEKVTVEAAVISEYIEFIQNRDEIANLFLELNKEQLNNSVIDIYNSLNKNVKLTHMYFIKTDGSVLLRVHDYKRDKDIINRATFKKAKENQSLFYGLEFGIKKNYTLRVVKPWIKDGKLIGYIELGKEIDRIINELSLSLKTEIYLAVKKEIYKNSPPFVQKALNKKVQTKAHYIVYNTSTIPKEIGSIIDGTISNKDIELEDSEYFVSKGILSDVSNKELGYFVFLSDITLEHKVMYSSIKILSAIIILIAVALIVTGYILIRNKEINIQNFTSKLQKLFNLQRNILITSDGKETIMANQAMFRFFGFKNLENFSKHYSCICDRFIVNENYFHLEKVPKGENWIEVIRNLPDEKRIVAMLDDDLTTHAFNVSVNEFEEGSYIVSFTDISNTMIEHTKLKRKVTHDKLTGALNREFFDNNIEIIIKEVYPKSLGVVLCDIDHFKLVNDTYGHNRGDVVLKDFTNIIKNSIRDTDHLIRWGGEEFIVLMKVNDIQSLQKVTENIRKNIEEYHFEEAGKVTSSFGVTLYIEGEEVIKTIERADKALYIAKESGRNCSKYI